MLSNRNHPYILGNTVEKFPKYQQLMSGKGIVYFIHILFELHSQIGPNCHLPFTALSVVCSQS
jgi:hypothetical protein